MCKVSSNVAYHEWVGVLVVACKHGGNLGDGCLVYALHYQVYEVVEVLNEIIGGCLVGEAIQRVAVLLGLIWFRVVIGISLFIR